MHFVKSSSVPPNKPSDALGAELRATELYVESELFMICEDHKQGMLTLSRVSVLLSTVLLSADEYCATQLFFKVIDGRFLVNL